MEALEEIKSIQSLLGTLFNRPSDKEVSAQDVSSSSLENQSKQIIQKILTYFDLKISRTERKKYSEGVLIKYHVKLQERPFFLKAYIVFESHYFNLTLWNEEGRFMDVVALGDLKMKYRMTTMGRTRLAPWVKGTKHAE